MIGSIPSNKLDGDGPEAEIELDRLTRQPAHAPGSLEVITADQAVDVEHLANEMETRLEPAFERPRFDFVESNAAAGNLGLGETKSSGDRQPQSLDPGDQSFPLVAREVGSHPVDGDSRSDHNGLR